ncbi:MAG TPA: folylpolyglutamate synthase/dihydrofolate synthase family protein [Caulobacteraceae bacterium]|nr:folylpolyglutamate synthase/dihydrofolate synthase family protein [Caulobacteraceae bacterium]
MIARLRAHHPSLIDLSTGRIERLLAALDHPERRMGPVIHVAGTNGKGSTCAFLRAMAEAAGLRVHALTSPHLVRFAERIRIAGRLIDETALERLTVEVEAANDGAPISFFEITTALAFAAFAEAPADLCVIEVGLGGRFDATNVFEAPAAAVITPVDLDHLEMLGPDLAKIAWEKAGIIKPRRPVVASRQRRQAEDVIAIEAAAARAPLTLMGRDFDVHSEHGRMVVTWPDCLADLPRPNLPGAHQIENAALAATALRAWDAPRFREAALAAGVTGAVWPARFQRLCAGPLALSAASAGSDLWLDGGHNPHAGSALANECEAMSRRDGRPWAIILGMLARKDAAGFLAPFRNLGAAVFTTGFDSPGAASAAALAQAAVSVGLQARSCADIDEALDLALAGAGPPHVLICGSLHFAGEVLAISPETWPT